MWKAFSSSFPSTAHLSEGAWSPERTPILTRRTGRQPILDVQPNSALEIRDCLLVGVPLAVIALKRGAANEIAVLVALEDDWRLALHPVALVELEKEVRSRFLQKPIPEGSSGVN